MGVTLTETLLGVPGARLGRNGLGAKNRHIFASKKRAVEKYKHIVQWGPIIRLIRGNSNIP